MVSNNKMLPTLLPLCKGALKSWESGGMKGIGRLGRRNPCSKELEEEQGLGGNAVSPACVLRQAVLMLEEFTLA